MANTLQIKRGVKASLPTLAQGEFGLTTDTDELYIGTGIENLQVSLSSHDHDSDYIAKAIGTAKGDVIVFSASGTPIRLGIGSDDQVLTADSAQAGGVKWATPALSGGGAGLEQILLFA